MLKLGNFDLFVEFFFVCVYLDLYELGNDELYLYSIFVKLGFDIFCFVGLKLVYLIKMLDEDGR